MAAEGIGARSGIQRAQANAINLAKSRGSRLIMELAVP